MKRAFVVLSLVSAVSALTATAVPAQTGRSEMAKATLRAADGKEVGTAQFAETPSGVLVTLAVKNVPAGEHAVHIHAVGRCEPPFTSAGGHFNPEGRKHGLIAADGHHAGDMPNLHIPPSGTLETEILNTSITLEKGKPNSVFDADGSAIIIHAGKDDYKTDPAGEAGGRIACGVIE